jgi:hypothetical protein
LQVADLLRQIASLQRPVCCDASEGTDPFEGKRQLFQRTHRTALSHVQTQLLPALSKMFPSKFGVMAWWVLASFGVIAL